MSERICEACGEVGDSGIMAWGRDEKETLLGVWVHDTCLRALIHKHTYTKRVQLYVATMLNYWGVGLTEESAVRAMMNVSGSRYSNRVLKGKDFKVLKLPLGSYAPYVNDAGQACWSHFDGANAGEGEWV